MTRRKKSKKTRRRIVKKAPAVEGEAGGFEIFFQPKFKLAFDVPRFPEKFMLAFCRGLKTGIMKNFEESIIEDKLDPWVRGHEFAWKVKLFCRIHGIADFNLKNFEVHLDGKKWRRFHNTQCRGDDQRVIH